MVSFLRRLFSPVPAATLSSLEGRVRALEAERLEVMTEWVKTRDQVLRYMKRAAAIRPRAAEPDEDEDLDNAVDLFRAKFRA